MTDGITVTTPFGTSARALLQALLLATSLWTLGAAACSPPLFTRLVVRWVLARRVEKDRDSRATQPTSLIPVEAPQIIRTDEGGER